MTMCWRFAQFLDIETVQLVKSALKQYKIYQMYIIWHNPCQAFLMAQLDNTWDQ